VGNVVSMDGFTSSEKCKCKFPDYFLVVITEFIKVFIELSDFCWDAVGDVFEDICVSKMLLNVNALFDVVLLSMISTPMFLSAQMMMNFLFLGRRRRAVFYRHELLGLEYLFNLDCSPMIW
jgi:hypothetical protein